MSMKNKNCFITSNPTPHYAHKDFADTLNPVYINNLLYKKPFYLIPFFTIYSFIKNFSEIRNNNNFLLVGGTGLFLGFLIKFFYKNKKIILLNADPFFYNLKKNNFLIKKIYKKIINLLDGIICNSKMNLDFAKKYYKGKNLDFVYPHIRSNILKSKLENINKKEKNFLYIGRESNEKNINLLIKYCQKENEKLYLIGNFSKKTIEKNKSENIIFLGHKNEIEIINLSKNIKYGFLLSNYDSFGITPIEYSKLGIIPIISKNIGSKEVLKSNDIILENIKYEELKNKIAKLEKQEAKKLIKKINNNIDLLEINKKNQTKKFNTIFIKFTGEKTI